MPPMRTSISTRSGLNLGMTFSPSSPDDGGGQLDFRRIKNPLERIPHVLFVINQQQLAHFAEAEHN